MIGSGCGEGPLSLGPGERGGALFCFTYSTDFVGPSPSASFISLVVSGGSILAAWVLDLRSGIKGLLKVERTSIIST